MCGGNTCTVPFDCAGSFASSDDGTAAAAGLTSASLDCQVEPNARSWPAAFSYCNGLGGGYRLPTKGEFLAIASNAAVCRTQIIGGFGGWTSTCAGGGKAWVGYTYGHGPDQHAVGSEAGVAICVR